MEKKINLEAWVEAWAERLVQDVFAAQQFPGTRAVLKRADVPSLAYQSWEFLLSHGVDIEKLGERIPAALVSASICRSGKTADGTLALGSALAACYEDRSESLSGRSRMRRLVSCDSMEELVGVLRPTLSFVESKGGAVCYKTLLKDLWFFCNGRETARERVKLRWMKSFLVPESASGDGSQREEKA